MFVTLILLILQALSLSAQPVQSAGEPAANKVEKLVQFLALGTGSMTGTYFPLGKAFANVWSTRSDKLSVLSHSTRGSIENINMLRRAEIDLAIAQSDVVIAAANGTGNFDDQAYPELRVLMALFPEVVQVVTLADANIDSIAQLREKKIVVGARGSGNAITSIELLSAFGISPHEYEPLYMSYDAAIQAMERRECEVAIIIAGIPTQVISELQKRVPVKIMNFLPEETAGLASALPYLAEVEIPAATYGQQGAKVRTLALMAMLVSTTRLDNDLAIKLNEIIFANLDFLQGVHQRARDISLETSRKSVPEKLLHPGAQMFFNRLELQRAGGQN